MTPKPPRLAPVYDLNVVRRLADEDRARGLRPGAPRRGAQKGDEGQRERGEQQPAGRGRRRVGSHHKEKMAAACL